MLRWARIYPASIIGSYSFLAEASAAMETGMKQLFIALAGFTYLYQGYNYPYYYNDPPLGFNAPSHAPFVYNGVDRDFYNPSNESSWDRSWRREQEGLR